MNSYPFEIKEAAYDISGIGAALLDFIVEVDYALLEDLNLQRGNMHLIDAEQSHAILKKLADMQLAIAPGGSAANTLAGVAAMGGKGIFLGKVGVDDHGDRYLKATEESGVAARLVRHDALSGHAITFITEDLERTFATHLGASLFLMEDELDYSEICDSRILHVEGYLLEPDNLRAAALRAIKEARNCGTLVSLDLADPALIDRIGPVMEEVVESSVDILFANDDEARAFTGHGDPEKAAQALAEKVPFVAVKCGAQGSRIATMGTQHSIDVVKTDVVNTNGAGDMYAAGVLYGIARGWSPEKCGRMGSYAASLVVASNGARYNGTIQWTEE